MKKAILLIILLIISGILKINALEITLENQKNWGNEYNDILSDIKPIKDNGYIAVGYTDSTDLANINRTGLRAAVIIKYDSENNIVWEKEYAGNGIEYFYSVEETTDGEYIAVGNTNSTDINGLTLTGHSDGLVVKYDKDGNMLWQKNYGSIYTDVFYDIKINENDELVIVGYKGNDNINPLTNMTDSDGVILKLDKNGNLLWEKEYGGENFDSLDSVEKTPDGGYIAVGKSSSKKIGDMELNFANQINDCIIAKFDDTGNVVWQNSYGGDGLDNFTSIKRLKNGQYIVLGYISSTDIEGIENNGSNDAIILKYNENGELIYQKNWGGSSSDYLKSMIEISKNSIYLFGYSFSTDIEGFENKGSSDGVIVLLDEKGNISVNSSYGGSNVDQIAKAIEINDKLIIMGSTNSVDIDNLSKDDSYDAFITKYKMNYNMEIKTQENGTTTVTQEKNLGIVKPIPKEGYEIDKIIIKNSYDEIIEVTASEDGTYSFPLYTDVSVEVLFKEVLSNPKTGVLDYVSFILIGLLISFVGYVSINYNNKKFEL